MVGSLAPRARPYIHLCRRPPPCCAALQAIVSYKWGKFAGALLAKQLAAYGLWLGAFTGFMLLFTSDDAAVTDFELLSTWQVGVCWSVRE